MGVCSSQPKSSITVPKPRNAKDHEEIALSVLLDKKINGEEVQASAVYKFLILGARGSGKSTFRRWAWVLSGDDAGKGAEHVIEGTKYDWPLYQRVSAANVRKYTIQVAKTICDTIRSQGLFVPTTTAAVTAGGVDVMTAIPQLKDNECVPTEIGAAIQAWWVGEEEKKPHNLKLSPHHFQQEYLENMYEPITPSPSGMRSVWLRHISRVGTNYPATDSTDHFMMRFATITSSEYKGDETDVVLCPLQLDDRPSQHILLTDLVRATVTTASSTLATVSAGGDINDIQQLPVPLLRVILGYANSGYPENQPVTEQICYLNHNKLLFLDVQQERSTRAKWLHCFENVGALLWFISLPDALTRDATGEYPSEMARQIADFHSIYEGPVFRHMFSIILVFTKPDVFSRLLATHSMTTYWPTYTNKFDDGDNSKAAAKAASDFICEQWTTIPPRRVAATTIVAAGEAHGTPLLAAGTTRRYGFDEEFGGPRRHHQPDLYPMILNQCELRVAELTVHNIHDICLRASLSAVG